MRRCEMAIEPLPNANAAAKCPMKNPQREKKSEKKIERRPYGPQTALRAVDFGSGVRGLKSILPAALAFY